MKTKCGDVGKSLCRTCKYKFRRVYIPLNPGDYLNKDEVLISPSDSESIIITNQCLISEMDIDAEITIECSHYINKSDNKTDLAFFKHLET